MNTLLYFVIFPVAAYFIGAIPFGVLIARSKGVDLRKQGSGNIGATNVGRVLGRKFGYICFLLDCAKGLLPVLGVGILLRRGSPGGLPALDCQGAWLAVGLGAILGHVFSVFVGFKGGKGVATSLGVLLGFYPYFTFAGLLAFAVWVVCVKVWRYVSLASIAAALAFPIFFLALCHLAGWGVVNLWPLLVFACVMALLVVLRHRANIVRLMNGTEIKIGAKKASPAGERQERPA